MTRRTDARPSEASAATPEVDFRSLFEALPAPYVMLDRDLTIVGANDAYYRATMTRRGEVVGHHLFEVFPDNPADPEAEGETSLRASLARAVRDHGTDVIPILRHDMRSPEGEFVERFWSPSVTTVWKPEGELAYIVLHIEDVTEIVNATKSGIEQAQATQQLQARYDQSKVQSLARERMLLARIAADRERLQGLVDAKDEFLNIISHELRTPLTIIRGNAAILLRPPKAGDDADGRHAALSDIAAESERISTILDNLLFLARPELDTVAFTEPCNVIRLAERAAADHLRRFPARTLKVEYDEQSTVVAECVDGYVNQILQNLLSNAEKYSPQDRAVVVSIEPRGAEVRISVLDSGDGFTADEPSQIFEPFFRIKDDRSRRPGVGIGLAVCKRLVEAMGGSIWATSRPEGGAEVGFSLPIDNTGIEQD